MIRKASGCPCTRIVEEYVQRHNPIWEELETVFEAHGVHIYSIFLDSDDSPQSTDLKEVFHFD